MPSSSSRAAIADRIDCICDDFESAILAGREPRIESFLDPQPEEIRPRLFKELLLLELDYRQNRGEASRLEEYESRFAAYRSILLGAGLVSKASTDAEADPAAKTTTWQSSPGRSSRFQFLRNLGSGAFGTVWLARDQQLDRVVAVKIPLKGTLTAKEENPPYKNWRPVPEDYAATINSQSALAYAESVGKRLPTEAEFEFAARNRGRSRFPWGNDPQGEGASEKIGPVGTPAWDRLDTTPPVFGLASNIAEWTSTWFSFYPQYQAIGFGESQMPRDYRVVRGGDDKVIAGDGAVTAETRDPRDRQRVSFYAYEPGLGFRCVRSAKPRWNVEDFETVLSASWPKIRKEI